MRRSITILVLASLALPWPGVARAARSVPTGQHPPALEAQIDRWFTDAMEAIYRGRPSDATRIADAMERAVPEDPRPYLLRARILRLDVPDQNEDRDAIGPQVEDSKRVLERAIAAADAILESDPESVAGHLYRGWAYMFLSQLHALANEYWGAGRKAAAGKEDLDFVLARVPDNPDALFVQGVYLYFADILPRMVKFARVLLRVPGGHRERGLEYLEAAAQRHGPTEDDAKSIYGVVLFAFEGRLEDAIARFDTVLADYPRNPTLVEPLAAMSLFFPAEMQEAQWLTAQTVDQAANSPEQSERKVASRLQFYLALQEMFMGQVERARDRLEQLSHNLPENPDWLESDVLQTLVDLDRMVGSEDAARGRVEALPEKSALRQRLYRRLQVPPPLEIDRRTLLALQPALQALYAGDDARAAAALDAVADQDAQFLHFYRGELELLRRQPDAALPHFTRVLESKEDGCWSWFRFVAGLRVAEIHGERGETPRAVR
ncbi:MAG: tetratricopeptide repeat protein, partial [Betaproteobacteria bacterium]